MSRIINGGGTSYTPRTKRLRNIDELIYQYETSSRNPIPQQASNLAMDIGSANLNHQRPATYYVSESLSSLTDSEICTDSDTLTKPKINQKQRLFVQAPSVAEQNVIYNLSMVGRFLEMLQHLPLPRMSFTAMGICFLLAVFISPRSCAQNVIFPAFRLTFGTLYPAYASYKAVRTKNVKEYVKWMMYWIVYAFFNCTETFTDIFLSWFPFYYEVKVIIVLWLLSPATKGSSTLYRKFVHPMLTRREQEIDEYLNQAKERGYSAVLQLGSKGVNYATNVIMQTALKGGGNLVQTIRRSYSLSDLSEPDVNRTQDEIDEITRPQPRMLRPKNAAARSVSGTRHSTGMYFSEVDVVAKSPSEFTSYNIRSSEDISSGYSSAEPVSGGLSRTSSMTNANRARFKAKRAEGRESSNTHEIPQSVVDYRFYQATMPPANIQTLTQTPCYDDWKDEVYFDNQQYFQDHSYRSSASSNASTCKNDLQDPTSAWSDEEIKSKYELFSKWLQETQMLQSQKNIQVSDSPDSEDEFEDPLPMEETVESDVKVSEKPDDLAEPTDSTSTTSLRPLALKQSLEEIQNSFRSVIETPIKITEPSYNLEHFARMQQLEPIVRRSPNHNKGPAPAPPSANRSTTSTASSSRSTSPMPDKLAKKTNLFKHYLPSIFRSDRERSATPVPEPDASTKSAEAHHRETQI